MVDNCSLWELFSHGQRDIGDFTAITTTGIAGWRYPIKTGAPSEYVIINIK